MPDIDPARLGSVDAEVPLCGQSLLVRLENIGCRNTFDSIVYTKEILVVVMMFPVPRFGVWLENLL